jgi:hypothetical protein
METSLYPPPLPLWRHVAVGDTLYKIRCTEIISLSSIGLIVFVNKLVEEELHTFPQYQSHPRRFFSGVRVAKFSFLYIWNHCLVRKDMDVIEHDNLFNIIVKHKFK